MGKKRIEVTETELAILEELWRRGKATIREISDALYEEGTTAQYATVQKLLDRLEAKGCVGRDRRSYAHRFKARISRRKLLDQELESLAERLCQGSLTPLLIHLTDKVTLSEEEREQLRKMIDDES